MKNIFRKGALNIQTSVPIGTTYDKLSDPGNCPACDGTGQVVVADSNERVVEECIMCLNAKEKDNGTK